MRISLVVTALIALLIAAAPADAESRAKSCARKGSDTVAATKRVRVYEVPNADGAADLYGCLRSSGLRRLLAQGYDDDLVTSGVYDHVRVAGRFVAWQYTATDISCKADCPPGYDPTTVHLSIRDLKARRTKRVAAELADNGRLVLTQGGAIAWSEDGPAAIKAFDGTGERTLDTGDVALGSLKLRDGNLASWTNAGEQRTARLKRRG